MNKVVSREGKIVYKVVRRERVRWCIRLSGERDGKREIYASCGRVQGGMEVSGWRECMENERIIRHIG